MHDVEKIFMTGLWIEPSKGWPQSWKIKHEKITYQKIVYVDTRNDTRLQLYLSSNSAFSLVVALESSTIHWYIFSLSTGAWVPCWGTAPEAGCCDCIPSFCCWSWGWAEPGPPIGGVPCCWGRCTPDIVCISPTTMNKILFWKYLNGVLIWVSYSQ